MVALDGEGVGGCGRGWLGGLSDGGESGEDGEEEGADDGFHGRRNYSDGAHVSSFGRMFQGKNFGLLSVEE